MFNKAKNETNTEVTNMNIGKNIAALRKAKGITQETLADELGVSPQAVSKWENNSSCPDISLLTEIARFFGVTVDELLSSEEEEILNSNTHMNEEEKTERIQKETINSINLRIRQQNGKENNIKIPFRFVKLGLNIAGFFGLSNEIADKMIKFANEENPGEIFEMDTETGEHISITLM